ncbi:MAG: cadherin-like beta sandwich domain-containing protein [Eubacteriales bacterium]
MKNSQKILRIISGFLAAAILLCLIPAASVMAAATLSVSIYSGNKEVGSTINVRVIASGDGPYQDFQGTLAYNASILQLTSLVQGDYPKANFKASGDNFTDFDANVPNGGVLVYASFKCLAAGSTDLSCSLDNLADINGNNVTVSGASAKVTVTTPVAKSSNADLAGLAISPGTLSPAFAPGTQSYTASAAANQGKITVSASPADGKSKVSLNGVQDNLAAGTNSVKVTVTAENGNTKVYTITVTKSSGPTPTPTPTAVPLPPIIINGIDYTILTAGTADAIPEGFTAATAKYEGADIPVLQKTLGEAVDASVMTLILLTADGKTGYYVYDAATKTCYPYQLISSTVMSFQILDESAVTSVPTGYEAFDYVYLDNTVTAFRLISDPSNPQILLYLMDGSGISAFYYYDTQNSMLMLYRGTVIIAAPSLTPTPMPTAVPSETDMAIPTAAAGFLLTPASAGITLNSLQDYKNPVVLLIYLLALFCLILLIVCIVLIVRRGTAYDMEDYEEDPGDYPSPDPVSNSPFVTPQPNAFFHELAKPQEENKLYFGDKPQADEVKLDFPVIPQSSAARKYTVPASVAHYIDNSDINELKSETNTSSIPLKSNRQIVHGVQPVSPAEPVRPAEHVPVRLQKALDAESAGHTGTSPSFQLPVSGTRSNDPDFDPDDE